MNSLLEIGFIPAGHWMLQHAKPHFTLTAHHQSQNVLYAFISNGMIKYIGKTRTTLKNRMAGYKNPQRTQTTNVRVNKLINDLLQMDQPVDIFILVDNGLLRFGQFRINLAAGLEDTLIYELGPEWNFSGKNRIPVDEKSEIIAPSQVQKGKEPETTKNQFSLRLGKTYYSKGFFNVPVEYSNLFANDNAVIEIQLGNSRSIQGYINRRANESKTPRIFGGYELRNWIQANFKLNQNIKVKILSVNSIKING